MTTPRSRVLAILTVVAMLAIGTVAGIALDRGVWRRRSDLRGGRGGGALGMMGEPVDTASRNRMRTRVVKRITDELTLTPAQSHAVDSIFARHELQLDALRSHMAPQLDSLRDQMRVSIDAVLTPDQRVKFAEQRKKYEARRKAGDGGGPPQH